MFGLDHDADPPWRQVVAQPVGHLCGEPFLHLRAAGEVLDDAGQLRQPEDAGAGQVTDMRDTDEWEQVVLADRSDRDGPGKDEFVVALP